MAASSSAKRAKCGSPALACDLHERLALVEAAFAAGARERPRELVPERAAAVARGELERLPQRLAGAERERHHRERVGQVEEDPLPPPLDLLAQRQIRDEEAGQPRARARTSSGGSRCIAAA